MAVALVLAAIRPMLSPGPISPRAEKILVAISIGDGFSERILSISRKTHPNTTTKAATLALVASHL
jgi:hypothetical protein